MNFLKLRKSVVDEINEIEVASGKEISSELGTEQEYKVL